MERTTFNDLADLLLKLFKDARDHPEHWLKELSVEAAVTICKEWHNDQIQQAKADAWEEGADVGWRSSGEGHNGEYTGEHLTHDGAASFRDCCPEVANPYEATA